MQIESKISKQYANANFQFEDTTIPHAMIQKYPLEYQAHLERIADFLTDTDVWEETNEGVRFYDVSDKWKKTRHHFRTFTFSEEMRYVSLCWKKCIDTPIRIPATTIIDENGKKTKINTLKTQPKKLRPLPRICTARYFF